VLSPSDDIRQDSPVDRAYPASSRDAPITLFDGSTFTRQDLDGITDQSRLRFVIHLLPGADTVLEP